jgi:hypothetical protein
MLSDLEMIAYNKRKKVIVKQTQKRKKVDLDTTILCTTEEQVIDTKRARLSDLLSTGLAISHATMDKARFEAEENSKPRKANIIARKPSKILQSFMD